MTTFRLPRAVPVEGLGFDSHEAPWLGRPAAEQMRIEASRVGLTEEHRPGEDVVTATDGVLLTGAALRTFLEACDGIDGDVVGVVAGPGRAWMDAPAFGPPARLLRLSGGGEWTEDRAAAATLVELEVHHRAFDFPIADGPGGRTVQIELFDEVCVSAHHHSGVLWANLLALGAHLWRELAGWNPVRWLLRFLWVWLRTRSTDPNVLAGGYNVVGRGARIHPSATVEGCWVGPGARIGAGAVVRGCVIGADAVVEPLAFVTWSVLGQGAVVQRMGWCTFTVLAERAAHAGAMQLGVLGPGSAVKGGAYLLDQRIGGDVRARRGGTLHEVPYGILGVGLGARTVVASGVWIAAGRAVPPDLVIVPDPATVLARVDGVQPGMVRVVDGRLEHL